MAAIQYHAAATDSTVACRYQELDRLYPGSKFILTVRGIDSWLTSVTNHFARHTLPMKSPETPDERFAEDADRILYGRASFSEPIMPEKFRHAFLHHVEAVLKYFEGRDSDLLQMDITSGQGWAPLCRFLAKPVPRQPFPHLNRGTPLP